jgi:hypothetical protein
MLLFQCDDYAWDPDGHRFVLVEPPTLLDDDRLRPDIQAGRIRQGWRLMTTHTDPPHGLTDLWTRPPDLGVTEPEP